MCHCILFIVIIVKNTNHFSIFLNTTKVQNTIMQTSESFKVLLYASGSCLQMTADMMGPRSYTYFLFKKIITVGPKPRSNVIFIKNGRGLAVICFDTELPSKRHHRLLGIANFQIIVISFRLIIANLPYARVACIVNICPRLIFHTDNCRWWLVFVRSPIIFDYAKRSELINRNFSIDAFSVVQKLFGQRIFIVCLRIDVFRL